MRGNAEVPIMKGFMNGFTVKGGENPETLPPEKGSDVLDEEKLDNKATGSEAPKGKKRTNDPDLTMDPELAMVEEGAKKDIEDGYVNDIKNEKVSSAKGFDAYNEMVSKGMAVDMNLDPSTDIRGAMSQIRDMADVTVKELAQEKTK